MNQAVFKKKLRNFVYNLMFKTNNYVFNRSNTIWKL